MPHGEFGEHGLADGARLDAPVVRDPRDDDEPPPVALVVPGRAQVRDSKRPDGPLLVLAPAAWDTFTADLRRQP
ncbi:DUF397 domain-containing protein [Streptomyces sp. NPDC059832]|uniref:DUF397 domain-containing protein n=1 Tax=unclassified Streptomyces TaxID=2593676 RepID=UPI00365FE184